METIKGIFFAIVIAFIIFSIFYWIGGFIPGLKNSRWRIAIPAIIFGIIIQIWVLLDK
jgi:hypothetical protein|tara:strand:+ start:715 stop:888 length:174 start_codon:yes stop_codon:yes gene_type:complete